jgi:apolipoprotein D and lipocalin family protein
MDRRYRYALAAAGAIAGAAAVAYATRKTEPLVTVRQVDLNRYAGTWYEIARYPNRFQKKCDRDAKAMYLLRDDGTVGVLNSCRKSDGAITSSKGTAKIVDPATNAKLKVTFFWPFSGDYWILDLAPDYSYAVVGEPSRKYLWILSRTAQMEDATYREITERIRFLGYDPARMLKTKQSDLSQTKTG